MMKKLTRIAIWGPPSSGKSLLAISIGKQFTLPVYHSDEYFGIEWESLQKTLLIVKALSVINKKEWVIDGNFAEFRREVLGRAQLIIILDLPFYILVLRLLKRTISAYSRFNLSSTNHFHKITYRNSYDAIKNELFDGLKLIISFKKILLPNLLLLAKSESKLNKIFVIKFKFNTLTFLEHK